MNGARTTYMRGGWLLTALAAVALLAASPGTAAAQTGITITGPTDNKVNEGGTATYTVKVDGWIAAATDGDIPPDGIQPDEYVSATSFPVTLNPPTAAGTVTDGNTAGEVGATDSDVGRSGSVNFDVPSNRFAVPQRFTATKTITLATNQDDDAENEQFDLEFVLTSANVGSLTTTATGTTAITWAAGNPNSLIITDDETQTYVLALTPNQTRPPTEGVAFTVDLTASPAHVQGSKSLTVKIDQATTGTNPPPWTLGVEDGTGTPATTTSVGFGDDDKTRTITITPPTNDANRVVDTVKVSVEDSTKTEEASLSIDVADIHVLQAVVAQVTDKNGAVLRPQPTSVEEGKSVWITVMPVDEEGRQAIAKEALTVTLAAGSGSADARDFRLDGPSFTIPASDVLSEARELMAETDEDVGMETLVLDATVAGVSANGAETSLSAGVLSIGIDDTTKTKVAPKADEVTKAAVEAAIAKDAGDEGLNPGESFTVMASDLFTWPETSSVGIAASVSGGAVAASSSGDSVEISAVKTGAATVTVTATASDAVASATTTGSQDVSNVASVDINVEVVDTKLVVTLAADPMEIAEGGTATITATANRAVTENDGGVVIDLSVVGDGTLDAESITIATGEMSGSATLTATEDDADYEDETITVTASGSGIDAQRQVVITVTDNDEAPAPTNSITAKSDAESTVDAAIAAGAGDEGFNPGESAMLDAADLFDVTEGHTASYAVDVAGDAASASASGSQVTVMADMAGKATVTITGTATAAGSALDAGQPATNVATVAFEVTVVDMVLTLTLDAPGVMDGNVVEGKSYDITVTANRAVLEDTMVEFSHSSASEADARDYSIDSVTISAGDTTATARLMVTEDMKDDAGHGMGEALMLYGMAGDTMTNTLELTIWDEAVPALPLIAQLLLALFLMAGGSRLYRRRQG